MSAGPARGTCRGLSPLQPATPLAKKPKLEVGGEEQARGRLGRVPLDGFGGAAGDTAVPEDA